MNLRDVTTDWLTTHGYTGLSGEWCGCELADLMPCDEPGIKCRPGYKVMCKPEECSECECECDGTMTTFNWRIQIDHPEEVSL